MHLIDKQHSWDQFCYALVNVLAHNFINFFSEFLSDFGLFWLHDRVHHAEKVLTAFWSGIGDIEIVKGDVLDDFLLFVDIAFWEWDVLLGLEIVFGGVLIATADTFDIT